MTTRDAIRVPSDLTASGWYSLLPPPPPPRVLEEAITADWVIIGGGFAGLFAARRLRQLHPKDRIVVLEAQRIAWGASGRNSGVMIDLPHDLKSDSYAGANDHDLKQIRMNRAAIAIARDAAAEAGTLGVFNPCGKYHGAAGASGLAALRSFEKHLEALSEPYTPLDAADMRRVTGTDYYVGGTHTPGAVVIQPAAFVRGLAGYLAAQVDIFENSPAIRIEPGPSHIVMTPKGKVTAKNVMLTNNGHLESFGYFNRHLMHIFLYASMTRALSEQEQRDLGGEPDWALIPADPMGSTVRRLKEGRIVVRNTFSYNPQLETTKAKIENAGHAHDRSFTLRFPMLKDVPMEHRWAGHLCLSLNSAPAFGEIEQRVYAAGCCNGLGTTKSTLAGHLIADLASGVTSDLLIDQQSEPSPQKLYPEPFMTLGARAKLWWMQRRAGADV
jgi:glycine/D-amino acid oxidase-like deaminating enzyme